MDFDANKPIYLQIIDEIKSRIVSARYAPGEKLPSVRDFAGRIIRQSQYDAAGFGTAGGGGVDLY